jgi:alkylation response protein AidB-like acyl-CoA dehydrogenase
MQMHKPSAAAGDFPAFLSGFRDTLAMLFHSRFDIDGSGEQRGMPPFVLREILASDPLALFIPKEHGGAGLPPSATIAMLEAAAYESLPVSLLLGISGLMFLHPLGKYGEESIKGPIFSSFLRDKTLGGLMVTEPGHGSDALNMKTSYAETPGGYHLTGSKHWGGLTGWADFWLLAARPRGDDGEASGGLDFFVCEVERPGQKIVIEERFQNLGLYMIPYGLNRIDVTVPRENRLKRASTGLRMLLDMLHRNRIHFPGVAAGFLRRVTDEAIAHCRERHVTGASLLSFDQVKSRIARIQAGFTACSAMCVYAGAHGGVELDLSRDGTIPNTIKTVSTDLMHEASHSLMQLLGAKSYRLDHFAGRAFVDSRAYQIFEGSNDILYHQLGEGVVVRMLRQGEPNLLKHLRAYGPTSRACEYFKAALDVQLGDELEQRKAVTLGRIVSRIITMDLTITMGERGFRKDLVESCLQVFREDVDQLLASYRGTVMPLPVLDYEEGSSWLGCVDPP